MEIILNGATFDASGLSTVALLLNHLGYPPSHVAVEQNGVVLPRAAFDSTPLQAGDTVEVVCFVGGG